MERLPGDRAGLHRCVLISGLHSLLQCLASHRTSSFCDVHSHGPPVLPTTFLTFVKSSGMKIDLQGYFVLPCPFGNITEGLELLR